MEQIIERCVSAPSEAARDRFHQRPSSSIEGDRGPTGLSPQMPILLRRLPRSRAPMTRVPPASLTVAPQGIFDTEDLKIIASAYAEACSFFAGRLTPAQRRSVALAILSHARRGLIDRRRLAIKGIVAL
jgi:hypothetical protein